MAEDRYSVRFVDYEVTDHVTYHIIVQDPNKQTWQIKSRYRRLRDIHDELKKQIAESNLPEFPPKKLFGNLDPGFISQRQKHLENYFNNLLKKYKLDELAPLKILLEGGRPSDTGNSGYQQQPLSPLQGGTGAQGGSMNQQNPQISTIERIMDQYKNRFFDLNDNFAPPDEEEIKRKSNLYEKAIKMDMGSAYVSYNIPVGSESNLISIQDKSYLAKNDGLIDMMGDILDKIKEDAEDLPFTRDIDIIIDS